MPETTFSVLPLPATATTLDRALTMLLLALTFSVCSPPATQERMERTDAVTEPLLRFAERATSNMTTAAAATPAADKGGLLLLPPPVSALMVLSSAAPAAGDKGAAPPVRAMSMLLSANKADSCATCEMAPEAETTERTSIAAFTTPAEETGPLEEDQLDRIFD